MKRLIIAALAILIVFSCVSVIYQATEKRHRKQVTVVFFDDGGPVVLLCENGKSIYTKTCTINKAKEIADRTGYLFEIVD